MEGEFDLKFGNGVSFVWERERARERKRELLGFLKEKMESPQTHIMRTKVNSCLNHVEAYGPKIANQVSKTWLLFLKTKSLRLDI